MSSWSTSRHPGGPNPRCASRLCKEGSPIPANNGLEHGSFWGQATNRKPLHADASLPPKIHHLLQISHAAHVAAALRATITAGADHTPWLGGFLLLRCLHILDAGAGIHGRAWIEPLACRELEARVAAVVQSPLGSHFPAGGWTCDIMYAKDRLALLHEMRGEWRGAIGIYMAALDAERRAPSHHDVLGRPGDIYLKLVRRKPLNGDICSSLPELYFSAGYQADAFASASSPLSSADACRRGLESLDATAPRLRDALEELAALRLCLISGRIAARAAVGAALDENDALAPFRAAPGFEAAAARARAAAPTGAQWWRLVASLGPPGDSLAVLALLLANGTRFAATRRIAPHLSSDTALTVVLVPPERELPRYRHIPLSFFAMRRLEKGLGLRPGQFRPTPVCCSHCGSTSLRLSLCANFRVAVYCGDDCQRAAWRAHRGACKEAAKTAQPGWRSSVLEHNFGK